MEKFFTTLDNFVVDYCEYLPPGVPEIRDTPIPTEFINNYLMTSMPFVLKHRDPLLRAARLWSDKEYLRQEMGSTKVTAAVSPNGRADSVVNDLFMLPEERSMKFTHLLDKLEYLSGFELFSVQKQNNLIEEFSPLLHDIQSDVPWATEACGSHPQAVNIWMGNEKFVSSMHKDHYDNIYNVIVGERRFELYPPIAMGFMPYKKYKKYQWYYETEEWKMKDLNEEIKWIPKNRQPDTRQKYLMYSNTKSYYVDVRAGQFLYIPAMWYHEVSQSGLTISVSYQYDMKYDSKSPFLRLFEEICSKFPHSCKDASVDKQSELQDSLLRDLTREDLEKSKKLTKRRFTK